MTAQGGGKGAQSWRDLFSVPQAGDGYLVGGVEAAQGELLAELQR